MKEFLKLYKDDILGASMFPIGIIIMSLFAFYGNVIFEPVGNVYKFLFGIYDDFSPLSLPLLCLLFCGLIGMILKMNANLFLDTLITVICLLLVLTFQVFLCIKFTQFSEGNILLIATIPLWLGLTSKYNSFYFKKRFPNKRESKSKINYPAGTLRLIIIFFASALILRAGSDFVDYQLEKDSATFVGKIISVKKGSLDYSYEVDGKEFKGNVSRKNKIFQNKEGESVKVKYSKKYPNLSRVVSRSINE